MCFGKNLHFSLLLSLLQHFAPFSITKTAFWGYGFCEERHPESGRAKSGHACNYQRVFLPLPRLLPSQWRTMRLLRRVLVLSQPKTHNTTILSLGARGESGAVANRLQLELFCCARCSAQIAVGDRCSLMVDRYRSRRYVNSPHEGGSRCRGRSTRSYVQSPLSGGLLRRP